MTLDREIQTKQWQEIVHGGCNGGKKRDSQTTCIIIERGCELGYKVWPTHRPNIDRDFGFKVVFEKPEKLGIEPATPAKT